jgi:hypothetical protein
MVPEVIGARDAQAEDGFGTRLLPPTVRQLEALLDHMPMATFDFTGVVAQTRGSHGSVIQMGRRSHQGPMRGVRGACGVLSGSKCAARVAQHRCDLAFQ